LNNYTVGGVNGYKSGLVEPSGDCLVREKQSNSDSLKRTSIYASADASSVSKKKSKYDLRSRGDALKKGARVAIWDENDGGGGEYFYGTIVDVYSRKDPYQYRISYDDNNEDDEDVVLLPEKQHY
jgi:hypothetical protein